MSRHFNEMKRVISPGLEKRCTYLSIYLPKFANKGIRSLKIFKRIYNEIKSVSISIIFEKNVTKSIGV